MRTCPGCGYAIEDSGTDRPCPECAMSVEARRREVECVPPQIPATGWCCIAMHSPLLVLFGAWVTGGALARYVIRPTSAPFVQYGEYRTFDILSNIVDLALIGSMIAIPVGVICWLAIVVRVLIRLGQRRRSGWRWTIIPFAATATVFAMQLVIDLGIVWAPATWMPD